MSSGVPIQRKPSRYRAIDNSLNRFWRLLSRAIFLGLFAVFLIEELVFSARRAVVRYGLPTCLVAAGIAAACLVLLWHLRAPMTRLLLRAIENVLSLLGQFLVNLTVIMHYCCFASLAVLIPLFGYLCLSIVDASITSFLTAPIGIKNDGTGTDYRFWSMVVVIFLAWAGYKSTKGLKDRWQVKRKAPATSQIDG